MLTSVTDVPKFAFASPLAFSSPRKPPPPGTCDTHSHVFGPYNAFPFVTPPSYPAPLAPFELYSLMMTSVGIDRGVLVQPAPYGADNRALVDAMRRSNGRLRGVAVATEAITDRELASLQSAGVRGLRFNEMIDPGTGDRFRGSVGIEQLKHLAPRIRELGWHAQVWARCDDVPSLAREIARLKIPAVFEHMASLRTDRGILDRKFKEILSLLAEGFIWVKLSVCRASKLYPEYPDLRPFHEALIEANPARLLWASDWPFVRMGDGAPDVGRLIDAFHEWVNDREIERRILVENAESLYGFQ
jgi:2-pyrone-4,6-dicarboxylate lactonase